MSAWRTTVAHGRGLWRKELLISGPPLSAFSGRFLTLSPNTPRRDIKRDSTEAVRPYLSTKTKDESREEDEGGVTNMGQIHPPHTLVTISLRNLIP